jgi:hypothetical protein
LEGGLNFYTLNFFLADDTIEVKEIRRHNSGKDPFPLLLNRKKMPKLPINTHYPGMTLKKEEFYGPADLICGRNVIVYDKEVLLFDCDEFTRHWYRANLQYEQERIQLPPQDSKKFT